MAAKKIALFIDADNISAKFGTQIIENLQRRGEIFIRRIYGNWEKTSLHGWNECILNFSLRAIQQPDYVAGKNATDMSLAIDAMDVLYGGKAEIFVLVSNDSDFTPLVIRLREGGMKIIGMGNTQASNSFKSACDEFINLDLPTEIEIPSGLKKKSHMPEKDSSVQMNLFDEKNIELKPPAKIKPEISTSLQVLVPAQPANVQSTPKIVPVSTNPKIIPINDSRPRNEQDKRLQRIHDILREAAQLYGDDSGFLLLNCAGTEIKNKNLDFSVKDLGYGKLGKFIAAFPNLYEVRENSYRCLTVNPKTSNDKLQRIHEVLRETSKVYGDKKGFVDLGQAGNAIIQKNLNIKDSGHSKLNKFISAFPNLYELKEHSYRCK